MAFNKRYHFHAFVFASLCVMFLFFLHHLPVNQLFIDPFSEAIKNHDVMDVAISRFRDHTDPSLFDDDVMILNSQKTNRKDIAEAIEYLTSKDVAGIGIDLIFDQSEYDQTDTLLARVLDDPRIVLGYTFEEGNGHNGYSVFDASSDSIFIHNRDQMAYVNLATNDGFSVRAFEPLHKIDGEMRQSFAVKLASKRDPNIVEEISDRDHQLEWINFKRIQPGKVNMRFPINSKEVVHYAYSSIKQLLADTSSYSDDYWKGKLVLVGFNGEHEKTLSMTDRYFTPLNQIYYGRSLPDMHGVVVHANIVSMLLTRDFITDIPEWILYLTAFLVFFFNYYIFRKLDDKKLFMVVPLVRIVQLIQFVLSFSFCIVMMTYFNIKFGYILVITAVILSFELYEFYDHKLRHKFAELYYRKLLKQEYQKPSHH